MNLQLHAPCLGGASTSYSHRTPSIPTYRRPSCLTVHHRRLARSFAFIDNSHTTHMQEPVCSLKKEKKKLAKSLKSHRKRLEKLLKSSDGTLNTTTVTEVFLELKRVQELLNSKEALINKLAGDSSDSSESESDCEPKLTAPAGFCRATVAAMTVDLEAPELLDLDQMYSPVSFQTPGRIVVCQGSKCQQRGAANVLRAASHLASESPGIDVIPCKCMGKCASAPAMRVKAEGSMPVLHSQVDLQQLPDILQQHFSERLPSASDLN